MGLVSGLVHRIRRAIEQKFKSAIPRYNGDRMLLSLLERVVSQPGMAERAYGEAEAFLIKGGLFMSGVRLDSSAYHGIGTEWEEDLGHFHYNPSAGQRQPRMIPQGLYLPHGLYVQIDVDTNSPFLLRREGGTLYLYLEEFRLFPVEFEKRPPYYSLTTSSGAPMAHIGPHRLQRQLLIEYNAYCEFFSTKTACLFCGIIAEKPPYHGHYQRHFIASPQEVAEVAQAAYFDGSCTEMEIVGGVLPGQAEVAYILEVGEVVKERLGVDTIPNSQAAMVPPQSHQQIDKLKEAGWGGVAFNLEVWDPCLWPGIAPGKAALMSRDRWLESLEYATQVFGRGQVASVLLAGLEPKPSFLEGVEWMAQRGIYGVPLPWTPTPGSALEGHQTPTAAWHLDIAARTLDIWERHGLDPHRHSSGGLHYSDLATMRQHWQDAHPDGTDHTAKQDLRYVIAVEGKIPDY